MRSFKPLILGAIFLALLIGAWKWGGFSTFDWKLFGQTFRQLDPVWVLLSVIFSLGTYVGRAVRWKVMILHQKPDAGHGILLRDTCIGYAAAVLAGRAGEFVRPYLIARSLRLSISSQLAIWSLERLMDLIAVLVLFGFALSQMQESPAAHLNEQIRWVLEYGGKLSILIGAVTLVVLIAFRSFSDISQQRVSDALSFLPGNIQERVSNFLKAFAEGMKSTRSPRTLALVLLLTLIEWLVVEGCYYSIFRSFPETAHLTLVDTLVVLGFVSFGSIIQIPGVGGGMQIVSVLVLTQLFAVPVEHATALAMILWAIGFAVIVPLGALLALRSGLRWQDLKQ